MCLCAELHVILEAHQVVAVRTQGLLAELHGGIGPAAGLGIGEAGWLHGAEPQRIPPASGKLLDGKAAFEVGKFLGGGSCDCRSLHCVRALR